MSERVVKVEQKGEVRTKGRVVVPTVSSLKVARPTHETTSNRVVTASSAMPEGEKTGKVFKARRTATTPR